MFSSRNQLKRRTPENGTDRESFLSLLVDEYLHSSSYESKCQVLANLANFAYDPINYVYIRDVGVLDIFIYVVKRETDLKLQQLSIAGICNLCVDPENADYILKHLGLNPIKELLKSKDSDIISNVITTLLYLYSEQTHEEIKTSDVLEYMNEVKNSEDKRLSNLATVFLQNVCSQV